MALWFLAIVTLPIALFGLGVYAWTLVGSIGANDRSLLFWYLPFLFAGILALRAFWFAMKRLRAKT